MTGDAWAGVDLGTQSVRSAVFTNDGELLGAASAPLTSHRSPGRHEQDPAQWLEAMRLTMRAATTDAAASGHVVRAVAVSATSGTIVPVDDIGRPTGMAVMYDDARGSAALDRVAETGADLWRDLGYRMQASWALPCLVAMIDAGTLSRRTPVAHQPDVVVSALTGDRAATDTSHALKTGADLRRAEWPADVLAVLGVEVSSLPDLVLPGGSLGEVSRAASAETGLPAGCLVVGGMTDGCAAQIAAGALAIGDWNSVLGTTLVVKGAASVLRVDPAGAVYSHRAPFGAGWWPGGASSTGAGALSHWLPGEDLVSLSAAASGIVPREPSYPLIGTGERFPFVAPDAVGFFDTAAASSPAERLAAVAYGVAFLERLSYERLGGLGYDVGGRLFATGGGSRNAWWVQLRADVMGRDVHLPAVREGAIGMAMLARAGVTGETLGEVAAAMLRTPSTVTPRAAPTAVTDLYGRFAERIAAAGWIGRVPDPVASAKLDL